MLSWGEQLHSKLLTIIAQDLVTIALHEARQIFAKCVAHQLAGFITTGPDGDHARNLNDASLGPAILDLLEYGGI